VSFSPDWRRRGDGPSRVTNRGWRYCVLHEEQPGSFSKPTRFATGAGTRFRKASLCIGGAGPPGSARSVYACDAPYAPTRSAEGTRRSARPTATANQREAAVKRKTGPRKLGGKKSREPFSAADERWCLRRDLFYAMCNILEGCYTDPKLEREFRRQKARLEKRFGYDHEPARILPEFQFSAAEVRRMKAAIQRNLRLPELTWVRPTPDAVPPATSAPVSELMSQS